MSGYPFGLVHLLAAALALGVALLATPLAGRLAGRVGLVAYPRNDRWHRSVVPLMGGVAIFTAIAVTVTVIPQPVQIHPFERFGTLLAGATLIFILGFLDDLKPLPPYTKLLGQIVAACVLVTDMPIGKGLPWSALIVPVTIFWVVGVTNAFNLLDNMDGLSAGIAAIVGVTLFVHNVLQGDHQTAMLCLVIASACAGFLFFNFNPARIFMGDSGSLVLGYLLAGVVALGASKATTEVALTLLVPVGVMALPILDTTLVTVVRSLNRRPISQGGRDHLSHRLVALGLDERSAVLILYAVSGLFGALAIMSNYVSGWLTLLLGALLVFGIAFFGIYLAQVRVYSESDYDRLSREPGVVGKLVLGGSLLYKRQIAEMLLDLSLICLGLLAAYLIRFDGLSSPANRRFVEQLAAFLPWVVSAKLATLFVLGTYRAIWRYMGATDLFRLAVASTIGSIVSWILVELVFLADGGAPLSTFLIDWLVVTAFLILARLTFVILREVLSHFRRRDLIRVLIVGAGDTGELVLRAMARSKTHAYRVVGFLDDNQDRHDRLIHGVRILGAAERLGEVAQREAVDQVVLTTLDQNGMLVAECNRIGVTVHDVGDFFRAQVASEHAAERALAGAAR